MLGKIKDGYSVNKDNRLNLACGAGMTILSCRLYLVYLSLIDSKNIRTRNITLDVCDFFQYFGYTSLTPLELKKHLDMLKDMTIFLPLWNENNKATELTEIPLFSEAAIVKASDGRTAIKMNCSDAICPFIFDLARNFVSYKISEIRDIRNIHYLRFFEIIRQHSYFRQFEHMKELTIDLPELRKALALSDAQYTSYKDFRVNILDKAILYLKNKTDVEVTYTANKHSKKVVSITFRLRRLSRIKSTATPNSGKPIVSADERESILNGFEDPIFERFNINQLTELKKLAYQYMPNSFRDKAIERHYFGLSNEDKTKWAVVEYLTEKINYVVSKDNVTNFYGYLKKAIIDNW